MREGDPYKVQKAKKLSPEAKRSLAIADMIDFMYGSDICPSIAYIRQTFHDYDISASEDEIRDVRKMFRNAIGKR